MHDIRDLDTRGIPGGFVASKEFIEAAEAQGNSLGFHPHSVFVTHPIQDRTNEEMQKIAEQAFDEVLKMIVRKED